MHLSPHQLIRSINLRHIALIFVLILGATSIKIIYISDQNIYFWFDQARDAIISKGIIDNHDLKIQGPSASGSEDAVFHGVLYFYIIGPLYSLFKGNVIYVAHVFTILTSLSVIPVYFLAKKFLDNSTWKSVLTILIYLVTAHTISMGVWLSNPSLAMVSIPLFYYFLWLVFIDKKSSYFPILMGILGITNQFAIYTIYLWMSLVLMMIYSNKCIQHKFTSIKQIFFGLLIYLLSISTIIITQLKLYQQDIFTFSNFIITNTSTSLTHIFHQISKVYLQNASNIIYPKMGLLSIAICITALLMLWKNQKKNQLFLALVYLVSPVMLIFFRDPAYHYLVGIEAIISILFAYVIMDLLRSNYVSIKFFAIISLLFFFIAHIVQLSDNIQQKYFLPGVEQGSNLKDQLLIIDKISQLTQQPEFSYSTLTNPYQYNTTWSYLFSWHEKTLRPSKSLFFGADQSGIFGDSLITQTTIPKQNHFTIYESAQILPQSITEEFVSSQDAIATVAATYKFNSLKLDYRVLSTTSINEN